MTIKLVTVLLFLLMAIKLVTVLLVFINGNKISHGTVVFY